MTSSLDPGRSSRTSPPDPSAGRTAAAPPLPHARRDIQPGTTARITVGRPPGEPGNEPGVGAGQPSSQGEFGRRGRVHLAKRQRSIDITAVGQLLLHLPTLFAGVVIVAALSHVLLPAWWPGVVLWLVSGAAAFHRPTERALARHLLHLRHPTPHERARLEPVWREVTARAGIEGRVYELWVEDSDHLNALATAGHIVGITRFALERLSSGQLAAVLSHELGHHIRGHTWSTLLGQWYAVPGRLAWAAVRRLIRFFAVCVTGHGRMSCWAAALSLAVGSIVLMAALSYWYVVLALALAPYLLAAVSRRAELRADHHAVAAGFGPMLAEVLYMMQAAERESGLVTASALSGCGETAVVKKGSPVRGRSQSRSGKLLSSHPDCHTRLHHLAPYLDER